MAGDQDTIDRTLSVAEAAAQLGLSTDAVRKRLNRGTLEGEKVSGEWRVVLPDNSPDNGAPTSNTPTGTASGAEIQDLRDTIEDLRTRLDRSEQLVSTLVTDLRNERERADTLQALRESAQDRVRELEALTASIPEPVEATESPDTGGNDASGINTYAGDQDDPGGMWARFRKWLAGE